MLIVYRSKKTDKYKKKMYQVNTLALYLKPVFEKNKKKDEAVKFYKNVLNYNPN